MYWLIKLKCSWYVSFRHVWIQKLKSRICLFISEICFFVVVDFTLNQTFLM